MGDLRLSFGSTNLDLENPLPSGFFSRDTITVYPRYVTGTPTLNPISNPGPFRRFSQTWTPSRFYYDTLVSSGSAYFNLPSWDVAPGKRWDIFDVTNLDVSKSRVDGGVPYSQLKDPTVYPTTTTGRTPIRGRFATQGEAADKFNQAFNPDPAWGKTYMEFMRPYM